LAPLQYILVGSSYALGRHIIPIYWQPIAFIGQNMLFIELVAAQGIQNEHVNRLLYGRWDSLDSIRTLINFTQKAKHFNKQNVACSFLHNITLANDDL
jgi:hypothetical protein